MQRVTLRLTDEQHLAISDLAYAVGESLNTELQRAVVAWTMLTPRERDKLRGGLPKSRQKRRAMIPAPAAS